MAWNQATIYPTLNQRFPEREIGDWIADAVLHLRGDADSGVFGRYLYHLVRSEPRIHRILNVGTARGYSTVCCARALEDAGREGVVHALDIIPPEDPRDWHVEKHPDHDPLKGQEASIVNLVSRFHDPQDDQVPVRFHTGPSASVLGDWGEGPVDLVFHDGEHTYEAVQSELDAIRDIQTEPPIHVFDDCYLGLEPTGRSQIRPEWIDAIAGIPTVGSYLSYKLDHYLVRRSPFPGVRRAVQEELTDRDWDTVEVVHDPDHAPITTLFPPS